MQAHPHRSISCYLLLGRQTKPCGQVQLKAPSLQATKVPLQVQVPKYPPYRWCSKHVYVPDFIDDGHGFHRKDTVDTYGLAPANNWSS